MLEVRKRDLVWSWTLIALNALALIWGLIPGLMTMYSRDAGGYVAACLWKVPEGNIMSNVAPMLIIVFIYCLIAAFVHLRNQTVGSIRGLFVGSVACCLLSLMAILPADTVEDWPYSVIPCILGMQSLLSAIRMVLTKKRWDKYEEEMED